MLESTGQPIILIKHSKVTDDYIAAEEIQNQNWQYIFTKANYCKKILSNFLQYNWKKFILDNEKIIYWRAW